MKMVMTPYERVFNAFLAKILDDEWAHWEWEEVQIDLRELLEGGIPWFKFPRVDLDRNDEGFYAELGPEEIQILATYMKCEWLNRTILSWENIKPLYDERDFSQANLLDKFNDYRCLRKTVVNVNMKCHKNVIIKMSQFEWVYPLAFFISISF